MPAARVIVVNKKLDAEMSYLLASIVESSDDAIITEKLDGTISSWNRGAEDLYGYSAAEVVGRNISMVFPPELQQALVDVLGRVARGDRVAHFETIGVRKDGRRVEISKTISPIQDESGNIIGASSIAQDITKRRLEQVIIEKSEILLTRQNSLMHVFLKFSDERMYAEALRVILEATESKYGVFGYIREDGVLVEPSMTRDFRDNSMIVGKTTEYPPEAWSGIWGRALKDKKGNISNESSPKAEVGHVSLHRNMNAPIVYQGELVGLLSVANKPTDYSQKDLDLLELMANFTAPILHFRLQIERQVRPRKLAEEQLNRLFNTSIDMVCVAGFDGYLKRLNPAWEKVLGWKPEDLLSRPYLDFVHPDDRERTIAAASGLSEGEAVITFENRYLCSDGSYRCVSWNSVPVMEEKLILAIVRDVTDQKRMEESLGEANKVLTHQAAELEFFNKELETFSYSVSHDLRAPLRHIDGFSHALLEDYADKLDAQGKDYLNRIRSGSQRMALLIDEILKLSQIVREKMVTSRVDLSALARSVASELQKSQPTRDVSLRIEDGIVVNGDQGLLKIVLDNLLGNAWKFTQGRQKALIEFGSQMIDGTKTYFVRDNGAGFDMAYASKLFVPFQRLHGNGEFQGTGIGLSIVQRVIRRHGGRIWAEAAVDAGATFYFTLTGTTRSLKR